MKLPVVSGKDTVKALLDEGFVLVSQKGSHIKLRKFHKPVGKTTVIVPNHKVLKKGTLAGFLSLSSIFNKAWIQEREVV